MHPSSHSSLSPERLVGVTVVALLVFLAGGAVGFRTAYRSYGKMQRIEEFRVHSGNLGRPDLSPQLREYLKSRLYALASILEPRDIAGLRVDYGPVDETVLASASAIKGGETPADVYREAMARHGSTSAH